MHNILEPCYTDILFCSLSHFARQLLLVLCIVLCAKDTAHDRKRDDKTWISGMTIWPPKANIMVPNELNVPKVRSTALPDRFA